MRNIIIIITMTSWLLNCQVNFGQIQVATDSIKIKNGEQISYFENGSIKNKQNYVNDTLDGSSTFYFKSGEVNCEKLYVKGVSVQQTNWSKDGVKELFAIRNCKNKITYLCKYDDKGKIRLQEMYFTDPCGNECHYSIYIDGNNKTSEGGQWE
ncbi:MAG: hypothetical protein ACI9N1_001811 [Flavobacteriales bacterium]|jgi:hypothetical protein